MSAVARPKASSQRSRTANSGPIIGPQGTHSSRPPSKGAGRAKKPHQTKPSGDVLRAKEEEYRRLNAELEAKTSELVKEAEQLMKDNLSILSDLDSPSAAANISGDLARPLDNGSQQEVHTHHARKLQSPPAGTVTGVPSKSHNQRPRTTSVPVVRRNAPGAPMRPLTSSHQHPSTSSHPHSSTLSHQHPSPSSHLHSSQSLADHRHFDHPPPSSSSVIPKVVPISVDIDRTVQRLEREVVTPGGGGQEEEEFSYHGDDILPTAAEGMGPEATIRFLKAKLRVMQEEMDRLCQENSEKDKQINTSTAKLKELAEQNSKLQHSHHTVQTQTDKYKQVADSLKNKCEGLEAQLVALRKEMSGMKTTQKKAASSHNALEVRLNRALEEAEQYKTQLQRARTESKDASKQEHQRIDQLLAENKQLEKQKSELISAFKKQLKLIDILKRQRMHIEAAKMLSFTEEEFVKALDWGAS